MARIPIYQQTQVPDGVPTGRMAQPERVTSAAGGFDALGASLANAGKTVADVEYQRQVIEQRSREDEDSVRVAKTLGATTEQWSTYLEQRKETAGPGAPDFTPSFLKEFDDYRQKTLDGAEGLTPKAKQHLDLSLIRYRSELQGRSLSFEAQARVDNKIDGTREAVRQASNAVQMDPSLYVPTREQHIALIDGLNIPPVQKSKLREDSDRTLALAAASGGIRQDPQGWYEMLTGIARRGEKVTSEALPDVAPAAPGADPTAPRGIRNNNPGNITRSAANPWEGEVAGSDPRYTSFATPEHGIRAMAVNLTTYQDKYGINTVEGIVSRWAPATENNTEAYVRAVAKAAGVKPDEAIDLHKPATMTAILRAMVKHENGQDPYSDATVSRGVRAALGGEALPTPQEQAADAPKPMERITVEAPRATGNPAVDALSWQDRQTLANQAHAEIQRRQAETRADVQARAQDAEAKAQDGILDPKPITRDEFVAAYGQRDGIERHAAYLSGQQFAADLRSMQTMPPTERQALLERSRPDANSPHYAIEDRRWNLRVQAEAKLRKEETDDPMAAAQRRGIGGVQPLNFQDQAGLSAELGKRAGLANTVAETYLTKPRVLTNAEASVFSQIVKQAPVATQKQYLAALFNGVHGDVGLYKSTLEQIAPDAPVVALAGVFQAQGMKTLDHPMAPSVDVAELILRGHAILNPPKRQDGSDHMGGKSLVKMPADRDLMAAWQSEVGDAYRGSPKAQDTAYQAAQSVYAALAAERGVYDGTINSDLWKSAIKLATGGVESHNGAKIVMPYGWSLDAFRDGLKVRAEQVAPMAAGVKDGAEIASLPLENVGDGRYMVRRGSGYLVDKSNGRPVVLDFNVTAQARPGAMPTYTPPAVANPGGFAVTEGGAVTGFPKGRR